MLHEFISQQRAYFSKFVQIQSFSKQLPKERNGNLSVLQLLQFTSCKLDCVYTYSVIDLEIDITKMHL